MRSLRGQGGRDGVMGVGADRTPGDRTPVIEGEVLLDRFAFGST